MDSRARSRSSFWPLDRASKLTPARRLPPFAAPLHHSPASPLPRFATQSPLPSRPTGLAWVGEEGSCQ